MFEVGDLVVCIKKYYYITEHKTYKIEHISHNSSGVSLFMRDDCGISQWYSPELFISLKEYRKIKIQNLQKICSQEEKKCFV